MPQPSASAFACLIALMLCEPSRAEVSIDGLYDLRHRTDPHDNANNFPVLEMKVFVPLSFGDFLLKHEQDLDGAHHDPSQSYTEISQSITLGGTALAGLPLSAHVGYSGGLGVYDHGSGGFYISNAYQAGLQCPFAVAGAYGVVATLLRYTASPGRVEPMLTLYVGRSFLGERVLFVNSLEAWRLSAEADTSGRENRLLAVELETELWYRIAPHLSLGTYTRTTRNVYALSNHWLVYPSVGLRYAF
jgi:hypothetical protein